MDLGLQQIFEEYYKSLSAMLPQAITALLIFSIFILLGRSTYFLLGKRIQRRWKDSLVSGFVAQAMKWIFYLTGTIIALNIVGLGGIAGGLIAGAGVSAIIFGFAFKDIGENFLAGILLAFSRPFDIGNIIEVEGHRGVVKDLDLRNTHLRNAEGKDIYIPNSMIMKNAVINYTRDGNLRFQFMIGVAPETDIETARILILKYLMSCGHILKDPEPMVLVTELGEFTTDIQILCWVDILQNSKLSATYLGHTIRSRVITDVKSLLDKNNIIMPSQVLEHKMYGDSRLHVSKD